MYLRMLKSLLAGAALMLASQSGYALQVGDRAPDFSLASTTSANIRLSDFAGKKSVVVFFFIGAFTKT